SAVASASFLATSAALLSVASPALAAALPALPAASAVAPAAFCAVSLATLAAPLAPVAKGLGASSAPVFVLSHVLLISTFFLVTPSLTANAERRMASHAYAGLRDEL